MLYFLNILLDVIISIYIRIKAIYKLQYLFKRSSIELKYAKVKIY